MFSRSLRVFSRFFRFFTFFEFLSISWFVSRFFLNFSFSEQQFKQASTPSLSGQSNPSPNNITNTPITTSSQVPTASGNKRKTTEETALVTKKLKSCHCECGISFQSEESLKGHRMNYCDHENNKQPSVNPSLNPSLNQSLNQNLNPSVTDNASGNAIAAILKSFSKGAGGAARSVDISGLDSSGQSKKYSRLLHFARISKIWKSYSLEIFI